MIKGLIVGGILGVVNYFVVFVLFGIKGGIGWVVFFIIGIMIIIFSTKMKNKNNSTQNEINMNNNYSNRNSTVTKETLLNELYSAEKEFNSFSFYIVKEIIENGINIQYNEIIQLINSDKNRSSREWIYSVIGNKAGDLLETGKYHVYRGVLDTNGQELLKIFDKSYDLLLNMGAKDIDVNYVNEQKATLRRNIDKLG